MLPVNCWERHQLQFQLQRAAGKHLLHLTHSNFATSISLMKSSSRVQPTPFQSIISGHCSTSASHLKMAKRRRSRPPSKVTDSTYQGARITQPAEEDTQPEAKRMRVRYEECSVCNEDLYSNRFPKKPHQSATEKCRACFKCWGHHFDAELSTKDWDKLGCLYCDTTLTSEECSDIAKSIKGKKQFHGRSVSPTPSCRLS